mmetsp:Transcript_26874/g.41162  ORF Transcript_26874/g.41162 Transcript_26874/m.41162 type:complete len:83 (-) Transcript_26874:308-556(-)
MINYIMEDCFFNLEGTHPNHLRIVMKKLECFNNETKLIFSILRRLQDQSLHRPNHHHRHRNQCHQILPGAHYYQYHLACIPT